MHFLLIHYIVIDLILNVRNNVSTILQKML